MKVKKNDFIIFIFPIGLVLGIIVTFVVRFLKMPKDNENKKNEDK